MLVLFNYSKSTNKNICLFCSFWQICLLVISQSLAKIRLGVFFTNALLSVSIGDHFGSAAGKFCHHGFIMIIQAVETRLNLQHFFAAFLIALAIEMFENKFIFKVSTLLLNKFL
jgi:hypothetical protein